jgi:hypothetical protein
LLELFTGSRCDPCVLADTAFDALIRTYRPSDVILVQHHLHIPGFDALTNDGSESRARYYGVAYTPFVCIDGKDVGWKDLPCDTAQAAYLHLRQLIERHLGTEPQARLSLKAERVGNQLNIRVEVSRLKKHGDAIRLRLVLVEDEVRYEGSNRVRLHHHVSRAFPGGVEGFAMNAESS